MVCWLTMRAVSESGLKLRVFKLALQARLQPCVTAHGAQQENHFFSAVNRDPERIAAFQSTLLRFERQLRAGARARTSRKCPIL